MRLNVRYTIIFVLFFCITSLFAQVNIQVTIDQGNVSTTCTDGIGQPEPLWGVDIQNAGWQYYPFNGFCHNNAPNLQFNETYDCFADVPTQINVCFTAFEDDAFFSCVPVPDCEQQICLDFALPLPGNSLSYSLGIAPGGDSEGQVDFTIAVDGAPLGINDEICNAIDLGEINFGGSLGDNSTSTYDNICGTDTNDPNPMNDGAFFDAEAGVWFSFTTGASISSMIEAQGLSDPSGNGDPINLEMILYKTDDNSCTGALEFVDWESVSGEDDLTFGMRCLEPNTTYYLLVDGALGPDLNGYFGLQIVDFGYVEGADLRCDAEFLGAVPLNGQVSNTIPQTNYCADDTFDPFIGQFVSQASVWYSFQPSVTGHVTIDVDSYDDNGHGLGVQMAVYRSSSNTCTGFFFLQQAIYTSADPDESITLSCLNPNNTYWILIDGDGSNTRGSFNISVSDAGENTPMFDQTITLCAGETLDVGLSTYSMTGMYADTLFIGGGCDSIVNTNLTILDELTAVIDTLLPATGMGELNGSAQANPIGGDGNYNYTWCNGENTQIANALEGGTNCCVTITDGIGCEVIECFEVAVVSTIFPTLVGDMLDCFGASTGEIALSAIGGTAPYDYFIQNEAGFIVGQGTINNMGDVVFTNSLPAGSYYLTINDGNFLVMDSTIITQPTEMLFDIVQYNDPVCFEECSGLVEVNITGGTVAGDYTYIWSNGDNDAIAEDLCDGLLQLIVEDDNGCTIDTTFILENPEEFIASITVDNDVSCLGGADGAATVSANQNIMNILWSNDSTTVTAIELMAGDYTVTVTNDVGCEATAMVNIAEPAEAFEVSLEVVEPIACGGDENGAIQAITTGPATTITYTWGHPATGSDSKNLPAGTYFITVTNELGCEAIAEIELVEPEPLTFSTEKIDVGCIVGPSGGQVAITDVQGGVGPYLYALNGLFYSPDTLITGLTEAVFDIYVQDAVGCEVFQSIPIFGPPELLLDLGPDFTIQLGEEVELQGLNTGSIVTYDWQSDMSTEFVCADSLDCFEVSFTPTDDVVVELNIVDTVTQCRTSDEVYIEVQRDRKIYVPNAFSPNGDGDNDIFMVYGQQGVEQVLSFVVADRFGDIVHSKSNFPSEDPAFGWDGNFRGRAMNTGVFTYYAQVRFIDGAIEIFRGDVTLMR